MDVQRDDDCNLILPATITRRGLLIGAGALGLGAISLRDLVASTSPANAAVGRKLRKGGTVVVAIDGSAGAAEPATYTTFGDEFVIDMVTRGLTIVTFESTKPKLLLARSLKVTNGGKRYTFELKAGLRHHDGTPVLAKDVVRTFERQLKKDKTIPPGAFLSLRAATNNNIKSVVATGDRTVVFDLIGPDPIFLSRIQDPSCHIISSTALEKHGAKIGQNLVGCGPFKLVSLKPQQGAVLEAFDDYVEGRPTIDRLVLQPVPNPSTLTGSLLSGQVHVTSFASHASARSLARSGKVTIHRTDRLQKIFVMMNAASEPLKELNVRKAINLSIDRNAIIKKAFFGYADYPDSYAIVRGEIGHDPSLRPLSVQNIPRAKAMIKAAGATGRTVSLIGQNNNWYPTALQIIEGNLKEIGLKPVVQALDPNTFPGKAFDPKGHDLALWERNNWIPDPATGVGSLFAPLQAYAAVGTNQTSVFGKLNDQVAALLKKAYTETNPARREKIYTQVQKLVADKMMVIAMVAYAQAIVASTGVKNVNATALSTHRMVLDDIELV